jgi:hypothetical protein
MLFLISFLKRAAINMFCVKYTKVETYLRRIIHKGVKFYLKPVNKKINKALTNELLH